MALDSPQVNQLSDGTIVAANGVHLVRFDGVVWDQMRLPSRSAGVRQFAWAEDGKLYAAGAGVIGYLHETQTDRSYVSLADQLPPEAAEVDELRSVAAVGDTVYFADGAKILIWRNGAFKVLPYTSVPSDWGAEFHRVGDEVFVTARGLGVARLDGEVLHPVADAPVLREERIVTLVAGAEPNTLLALTADQGFWLVNRSTGAVSPWETDMNRRLAGKRVFCARRLRGGGRSVSPSI